MFRTATSLSRTALRNITLKKQSPFSTIAILRKEQPRLLRNEPKDNSKSKNEKSNPEMPVFSLDALGLSTNMKRLVIGIIGFFGIVETWVWCKGILRWWKGREVN